MFQNVYSRCRVINTIYLDYRVSIMVFNATFNNIAAILWQSVLLVEETGMREENRRSVASH